MKTPAEGLAANDGDATPQVSQPRDWDSGEWCNLDQLAFCGRGGVSDLIRCFTCSPQTHFALLAYVTRWDLVAAGRIRGVSFPAHTVDTWRSRWLLLESTTTLPDLPCEVLGCPVRGVQAHTPHKRIASYPGKVELWRLTDAKRRRVTARDVRLATQFALSKLGSRYDMRGAMCAGVARLRRHLPARWNRQGEFFCNELCTRAFKETGLVANETNASNFNPGSWANALLDWNLCDEPVLIKGA